MSAPTMPSSSSPAAAPNPSSTSPPSDPKSDLPSSPDAAAAADQPAPSVPSVVPADDVGESDEGEGTQGAEIEGEEKEEGEEDEEEGECGFCIFMKSGGCKDSFVAWEDCVEKAEQAGEDVVEKCSEITALLKQCMEAHSDYYEPILQAEKAVVEKVLGTDLETGSTGTEEQNEGKHS